MNQYEITTILDEKTEDKKVLEFSKWIKEITEENDGKIESEEKTGRKKLAYQIKKNDFGIFIVFKIEIDGQLIKKIHKELKLSSDIIRFLIIRLPKIKPVKGKTKEKIAEGFVKEKAAEKKVSLPEKTAKKIEEIEKAEKPVKKAVIKKEKPKEKPAIAKEIESEDERMKKLEEELDKILEE
jgi:small subunit ribosomal protein S6